MNHEPHREALPIVATAPGLEPLPGNAAAGIFAQATIAAATSRLSRKAGANAEASKAVEEKVLAQLAHMRQVLEGPEPTPLERILAERVVVCYAALTALECSADGLPTNLGSKAGADRVDRLHRRFNEACKALATVQKMRLPSSPVFVGGQHVHLGGG